MSTVMKPFAIVFVVGLGGGVMAGQPTTAPADSPAEVGTPPHVLSLGALDIVRSIPVQFEGRWAPLDTAARATLESVTGQLAFQGRDPVGWLLACTFQPGYFKQQPMIPVANAELRELLELSADRTRFSYDELLHHKRLRELMDNLRQRPSGGKMDPLESKVNGISQKLSELGEVFRGQLLRIVPDPEDPVGAWARLNDRNAPASPALGDARGAWDELEQAFEAGDEQAFVRVSGSLRDALLAMPAAYRPSPRILQTELHYNLFDPMGWAWKIMAAGAVLALLASLTGRGVLHMLAVLAMLAGFAMLSYGLGLRWTIAGRIPAANMYESLLFLSWGMGLFGIVSILLMRDRIVPLNACAMGALALFLAQTLPLDSYVRPIAPVLLDTIWMSIHVPVIMVSYSVLALAAVVAHVQLFVMAGAPRRTAWIERIDRLHYWYLHVGCILLGAGIVTGSMWAASSWGRYWGWDPKEVWSLIAFLGYLAILHLRVEPGEKVPGWIRGLAVVLIMATFAIIVPRLAPLTLLKLAGLCGALGAVLVFVLTRGPFAAAVKSILAFWLIVMTYVGVNFVLGIGLHSYGFGTGAVVQYMFLLGSFDLLLIGVCTMVYAAQRAMARMPINPSPTAD